MAYISVMLRCWAGQFVIRTIRQLEGLTVGVDAIFVAAVAAGIDADQISI
jgi:hypothetical protein